MGWDGERWVGGDTRSERHTYKGRQVNCGRDRKVELKQERQRGETPRVRHRKGLYMYLQRTINSARKT